MKIFKLILISLILSAPSFSSDDGVNYLKGMSKAFSSIAIKTSPAVVFIETEKNQQISEQWHLFSPFDHMQELPFNDDILKHFFKGSPLKQPPGTKNRTQKVLGQGSGFIFSQNGYILTNNHVVGDADKVIVKLLDGRRFVAKVTGSDQHSDIAVIKIKAKNLTTLPLGNSDKIDVGEWVIALGNPFGLSHSLTAGVVSAKGRSSVGITNYENFIQTDAAINLGNSGGPLINLDGEAIGINTAIYSRTGGSLGIGFAIPINMAKGIKDQLIKNGKVTRGYIGVVIQNLTSELAEQFDIKNLKGILISDVSERSPAKKAGLKTGDVIIKFSGKEINNIGIFRNMVASTPPGKTKSLSIIRNGKRKDIKVKIGRLPGKRVSSRGERFQEMDFGFSVDDLTPLTRQRYGITPNEKGIVISDVDPSSIAAMAGIKPGLLIKEVNKIKVNSVAEFKKATKALKRKNSILLLVQDGEYSRYVALSIR